MPMNLSQTSSLASFGVTAVGVDTTLKPQSPNPNRLPGGLLALRTGGLWAAFAAHGVWNWTESCGVGLDPNPGVGAFGALIDLDLAGPALWSGGEDGLNGSLALTLVLGVIVTVLIALRARPR
jgi:hypothetical protein